MKKKKEEYIHVYTSLVGRILHSNLSTRVLKVLLAPAHWDKGPGVRPKGSGIHQQSLYILYTQRRMCGSKRERG